MPRGDGVRRHGDAKQALADGVVQVASVAARLQLAFGESRDPRVVFAGARRAGPGPGGAGRALCHPRGIDGSAWGVMCGGLGHVALIPNDPVGQRRRALQGTHPASPLGPSGGKDLVKHAYLYVTLETALWITGKPGGLPT